MSKNLFFATIAALAILGCSVPLRAQCPEQPGDNGICDTMYVEVYERDWLFSGEPSQVRVPIRVTNDIPDPLIDSIVGMVIPLCFTTSNPGAQCFLDPNRNQFRMYPPLPGCYPWNDPNATIFRHLPGMENPQEHNFMMDLCLGGIQHYWDTMILDLVEETHFWLALVNTGPDQRFWGGSRVLIATPTFTIEDTMTICLDSCFWPPTGRLAFSRSDAVTYFPRTNLPYCFTMARLGDCTGDNLVDIADVVFLINYIFRNGVAPDPIEVGDANCDGIVDVGDVVRLIGYLYKGEPPPSC